jgi:hypothetical protein
MRITGSASSRRRPSCRSPVTRPSGPCHAWLEAGGVARDEDTIVQKCAAGLIQLRRIAGGLAFAAPPLLRNGAGDIRRAGPAGPRVDGGTLSCVRGGLEI